MLLRFSLYSVHESAPNPEFINWLARLEMATVDVYFSVCMILEFKHALAANLQGLTLIYSRQTTDAADSILFVFLRDAVNREWLKAEVIAGRDGRLIDRLLQAFTDIATVCKTKVNEIFTILQCVTTCCPEKILQSPLNNGSNFKHIFYLNTFLQFCHLLFQWSIRHYTVYKVDDNGKFLKHILHVLLKRII